MYTTRIATKLPQTSAQLSKAVASLSYSYSTTTSAGLKISCLAIQKSPQTTRHFSTTPQSKLRVTEYFPEADHEHHVRKTEAAWPHPGFTEEQILSKIRYEHRTPRDFSDRIALGLMRLLRWGADTATGYHHDVDESVPATTSTITDHKANGRNKDIAKSKPYRMSERKWLIRFIFLESVAGVPGMVAGMLRHLRSLRALKRDNGWIETLLEESYNERMHLLTFLKLAEPGWFMKAMIIGAQGVFFNSLFFSYLVSPRTVHRFVGYLEEEAVLTYGLAIADLEEGKLPEWEKLQAPDLAVDYWKMPEGKRSMRHLLLYIRADEAKHREVNHTLGNLNQALDPNPFVSEFKEEGGKQRPGKGIQSYKGTGWERDEVI